MILRLPKTLTQRHLSVQPHHLKLIRSRVVYKSYPRPSRIRVSARQRLRAGGSSARRLPRGVAIAAAASPIRDGERTRPISRFFRAPWGCGGCSSCATVEPTRVDGLILRGRTTTTIFNMRARGSGRIRRGRGAALAYVQAGKPARAGRGSNQRVVGRFRRGRKGSAAGGRRVRSWRTDVAPSQATQLR
jgi:hypothetical protein